MKRKDEQDPEWVQEIRSHLDERKCRLHDDIRDAAFFIMPDELSSA
jgi:hypothetical protein